MSSADTSNRLPILAAQINEAHDRTIRSFEATVASAIAAGMRLIEAKDLLKHGQWLPWLRDNCDFSDRTAQNYMRLAKRKDVLDLKSAVTADLTIEAALVLTDHTLYPLRGFARLWSITETHDYLFIEESSEHPGHYFATVFKLHPEFPKGASTTGLRRPIKAEHLPKALLMIEGGSSFLGVPFTDIPEHEARELRIAFSAAA